MSNANKAVMWVLLFCTVASAADRFTGRRLSGKVQECPNYGRHYHPQKDLRIEVTYLQPNPSAEQTAKYAGLTDYPMGALYGRASVHLSAKMDVDPKPEYFKVSKLPGEILGLQLSEDRCDIVLDFVVKSKCEDGCVPYGACIELDHTTVNKELGYVLPFRKACRSLLPHERPRCLDASVVAMGLGMTKGHAMPYTSSEYISLMLMFNGPFHHYVEFKPSHFTITGCEGSAIEAVQAALPKNAHNIAYTMKIRHGHCTKESEIKVCFVGGDAIRASGTPYDSKATVCVSYMKSTTEPETPMPTMELHKAKPTVGACHYRRP